MEVLIAIVLALMPATPAQKKWSALMDAICEQESGGYWRAKNGSHYGAYQVSARNVGYPPQLLYFAPLGRVQAQVVLRRFMRGVRKADARKWGSRTLLGVEGYRHGYAGVWDKTDKTYALCVMARIISARNNKRLPTCNHATVWYSERNLLREWEKEYP